MPRSIHAALAAASIIVSFPALAIAQTAKQCLTPKEAQGLISFVLPDVIAGVASKCAPSLSPKSYLSTNGAELAARYRVAAAPNWPAAKQAMRKIIELDKDMMAALPDEALKGFFGAGVSTAIVKDIEPPQCSDIDRVLQVIDPLPAESMTALAGILLEFSARPKAQALQKKSNMPFTICPAPGSGAPVNTK